MSNNKDVGHKLELGNATDALADAITHGDADALRKAAGDHATALNSQASAMAAAIAKPLYAQGEEIAASVKQLAEIVTNARQADLNWRTEERTTRDAQSTRLYEELDKLIAAAEENSTRLGKLEQGQIDYNTRLDAVIVRLDTDEARLDRKRERIDALELEVRELRGPEMPPEQRQHYIDMLIRMIEWWKAAYPDEAA